MVTKERAGRAAVETDIHPKSIAAETNPKRVLGSTKISWAPKAQALAGCVVPGSC